MDGAEEFGVGGTCEQGLYGDGGEGLEVVFIVGIEVESRMTFLRDVHRAGK